MSLPVGLVLSALLPACGSVEPVEDPNPLPLVFAVDPAVLEAGGSGAMVTVVGDGFAPGARLLWNGGERETTLISATEVQSTLQASDLLQVGTASVAVRNPEPGGGTSRALDVEVGFPVPVLDSVLPSGTVATAGGGLTLVLHGSSFATGATPPVARWNGIALPTTVVDGQRITANVPDNLLQRGGTVEITVRNPSPGGGDSNAVLFALENPVPQIVSVSPDTVTLETATTLVISGSGFVSGAQVLYADSLLPVASLSATSLTVSVPAILNQRESVALRLVNPGPGGGESQVFEVPVRERPPYVLELSKYAVIVGAAPATIEVIGYEFAPDAAVLWNGEPRVTRSLGPGLLEADLLASDFAEVAQAAVQVMNPRGGGTSEGIPFGVVPEGRVIYERLGLLISNLDGTDVEELDVPGRVEQLDTSIGSSSVAYEELTCDGQCRRRLAFGAPGPPYARVVQSDSLRYYETHPSFTADGQWVYFTTTICPTVCGFADPTDIRYDGLWRVRPDGTSEERVSSELMDDPAPSSTGAEVAFTWDTQLHVLDVATSAVRSLGVRAANPEWSPDDEWIVFWDEQQDVRLIRPDGTDDHLLASSFDALGRLSWSPDGRYVVATSDDEPEPHSTSPGDARLIDVQTGEVIRLSGFDTEFIAWMPN